MGIYDDVDDEDFETGGEQPQGPAELRKAYEKMKKANAKLEEQVNALRVESSKRTLGDVLQKRELNPALSKFILADGVDGSDEGAVDTWLTENGALFGYQPKASEEKQPPQDERAALFAQMQNAQTKALPADDSKLAELHRRMDAAAADPVELAKILAEAGPLANA